MKNIFSKSIFSLAMAGTLAAGATYSNDSHACASEPYLGSICIMAWPKSNSFGSGTYVSASGATLSISQYTALYSVIGITYGGNGTNTFMLPNLQGRTIVGAGVNYGQTYQYGQTGGAASVTLTSNQLPAHAHTANTITVNVTNGDLAANTTLSGLTLKGASAAAVVGNPSGAAIANTGLGKNYVVGTPDVSMAAGSVTGSATTTLTGTPAVTLGGMTGSTGTNTPVSTMSPYVAMPYYIAVQGIYPSPD